MSDLLTGPLPNDGLLCVEASAGTGKTYLLSTLATRWLVESDDVRIADLLMVTFTVAAAAELRGKVRTRLAAVRDRLSPAGTASGDDYLDGLALRSDADILRARAERALSEFDTASIKTIHAFAAAAMGSSSSAVGPAEERRNQAVADVVAAEAFDADSALWRIKKVGATTIGKVLERRLDHPDLQLAPIEGSAVDASEAIAHRDAVVRAMDLFTARQRQDGVFTFADLLSRLDSELADPRSRVLRALRSRYRIGLIDEFQDTDPVQWSIFRQIFLAEEGRTLVVVGDPKQAIYGFRGADVSTYLQARSAALDTGSGIGLGVKDLGVNYRSDGVVLRALNGLLGGTHFDEGRAIAYLPVSASPGNETRRAFDASGAPVIPLSIRVSLAGMNVYEKRRAVAEECALEAVRALSYGVVGEDGDVQHVDESDIAVLCAASTHFPMLKEAFLRQGIRMSEAKAEDVLASPAALQVSVLLRALQDPGSQGAVTALGHSWFGSSSDDGPSLHLVRSRLAAWGAVLSRHGIAALGRAVTEHGVIRDLLAGPSGERNFTDLQHLFDLLAVAADEETGPTALLELLAEMGASQREAGTEDTRARRIDTDAPAVRLMTVHGSKGLEFKVVLCPFPQKGGGDRGTWEPTVWRDPVRDRLIDAGGGADWTDDELEAATPELRKIRAASDGGGEDRRLVYVALTRAKHRCVVWWVMGQTFRDDELAALLFDRDPKGLPLQRPRQERSGAPYVSLKEEELVPQLRESFAPMIRDGLLEVATVAPRGSGTRAGRPRSRAGGPAAALGVATMLRALPERDRRCSFSSLVAGASRSGATLDPVLGDAGAGDEGPSGPSLPAEGGDEDAAIGSTALDPFAGLAGASFGTAVHEALEIAMTRPRDTPFEPVARDALAAGLRDRALQADPAVIDGLLRVSSVPIMSGLAIRDLERGDVATELRFSLPVADGVDLAAIGDVLADGDAAGPFSAWSRRMATSASPQPLAQTLVGSIDLVTTFGSASSYWVIDYKTNLCAPDAGGYSQPGMVAKMQEADYPLQAALYLVALHRYLRWRVDGYDPDVHLGGSLYLFLRGMRHGSDDGICPWRLPGGTVATLSDTLAGVR